MISSAVMAMRSTRRRHCRLDRRVLGGCREPFGEPGMFTAPIVMRETVVEVTECADHRDRADRELALQRLGLRLELVEAAVDLLHLALDPVAPALVLRPQEGLVAGQDRGIEQTVGHGLKAQCYPAIAALARQQPTALVLAVEIFADHRRVEEIHALDREHRDLADGIVLVDVGVGRDRRQRDVHHLDLLVELGLERGDPDLACVGRGRRVVELHLGHRLSPQAAAVELIWGISVSFSRTLRATSISCCHVVVSMGMPFFCRSARRMRSGSPGASTSLTPGWGLADLTQVMKVSTSSSNSALPPIASGSMMIDSMLLMMSVPSFLM